MFYELFKDYICKLKLPKMQLVFASNNQNKIKEIQLLLPESIQILSLSAIGCFEEIPETSDTIEGNAILKANFVTQKYGYDCFADDTGLEVEALNGAPGASEGNLLKEHQCYFRRGLASCP